jgi:tetratricopeptide (TPR) repeat protein
MNAPKRPRPARPENYAAEKKEGPGVRFWVGLLIFQCIFGASIFVLTKAHYERPSAAAARLSTQNTRPAAARSENAPQTPTAISSTPTLGAPSAAALDGLSTSELRRRASAFFTAGDYVSAVAVYQALAGREAGDLDLRSNLAISTHYAGDSASALEIIRTGLAATPSHQRSWLTLGFISRAMGDTATARDALNRAIAIDAGNSVGQEAAKFLQSLP